MDTRSTLNAGQRIYQDFVPPHELVKEEAADTLLIVVAGFKKEQIKVQIDNYGKLRIMGERPLLDNRWSRFRKEFQVPENCNSGEIRAKFENGVVLITLPKLITEEKPKDRLALPQKPTAEETKEKPTETKPSATPHDEKKRETEERKMDQIQTKDSWKDAEETIKDKDEDEESGEEGDEEADDGKKATEEALKSAEGVGRKRMEENMLQRSLFFYKPRQSMWSSVAAVVVLVSLGFYYYYYNYQTNSPTESSEY